MRFMMLVIPKGYEKAPPGTLPDTKLVEAMTKYNESLTKAGVLLALDGLHPPSTGSRVAFSGGKPTVTDGPFAEVKEVLGGYWMIQVKSKADAIAKLGEEAAKAGVLVEMGGLLPTAMGARVRLAGGKVSVTDGPLPRPRR